MLSLNNAHLLVSILDPIEDQNRFGARYCTAGYIYQITDHRKGDLLSGPTFPHSFNWFDGQGIPDSFRTHLVDTNDVNNTNEHGIGIGLINRTDNHVVEFCPWQVVETRDSLTFNTTQKYLSYSYSLTRTVRLVNRSMISETVIQNTGSVALPINWFPHPFFPHYETGEACKCSIAIRLPENPAYELTPNGFIIQKSMPWDRRGFFQELDFDKGIPLNVLQKHPKLGLIAATFSYAPGYF
ncbi:MAG TPA: hypothetical protein VGK87_16810, partial [Anaerolineae bacterium]